MQKHVRSEKSSCKTSSSDSGVTNNQLSQDSWCKKKFKIAYKVEVFILKGALLFGLKPILGPWLEK
jgi:hypothetical protein